MGGSKPPAIEPTPSAPAPTVDIATDEAKKNVRSKPRGRQQNILAGRLNSEHGKILLGE